MEFFCFYPRAYWITYLDNNAYIGVGNTVGKNTLAEALDISCSGFEFEPTSVKFQSTVRTGWIFDIGISSYHSLSAIPNL